MPRSRGPARQLYPDWLEGRWGPPWRACVDVKASLRRHPDQARGLLVASRGDGGMKRGSGNSEVSRLRRVTTSTTLESRRVAHGIWRRQTKYRSLEHAAERPCYQWPHLPAEAATTGNGFARSGGGGRLRTLNRAKSSGAGEPSSWIGR